MDISFLVAEAHEKLDKSLFTRKLGPRLRVEIGAAKFDPKRFWAALNFPCIPMGGRGSLSPRNIRLGVVEPTCWAPLGCLMKAGRG